jgi:hypothetical protein
MKNRSGPCFYRGFFIYNFYYYRNKISILVLLFTHKTDTMQEQQPESQTANRELTPGQRTMGINFNPAFRKDVQAWKHWCAKMYDWLNDQPIQNEGGRLKAIAQTHLETFQMSAVQAVTYFEDFGTLIDDILPTPTNGQLACTVSFNEGGRADVNFIKSESATAYDNLEGFLVKAERYVRSKRAEEFTKQMESKNKQTALLAEPSPEQSLLERKLSHASGIVGDALYSLRQFQKFAVKAVTR